MGTNLENRERFYFPRRVPDFCDGRRSSPTNQNSNLYRSGHRHPSVMDFARYQSPKLLGSSPSITNKYFIIGKFWDRPLAHIRYIGKIWDGRKKVKSPIVWDFPDIWKPGLVVCLPKADALRIRKLKSVQLYYLQKKFGRFQFISAEKSAWK